jgi:hypothetical protein
MFNFKNTLLFALLLGLVAPVAAPHKPRGEKTNTKNCITDKSTGKRKKRTHLTDAQKAERKAKRTQREKNMTDEQKNAANKKRAERQAKRSTKKAKSETFSITMPTDAL